jgi:hypothetical protein
MSTNTAIVTDVYYRDNQARARMVAEGGIHKEFVVDWVGREGLSPLTHEKYLSEFVNHFYKHVIKLVDRGVRKSTGTGTFVSFPS